MPATDKKEVEDQVPSYDERVLISLVRDVDGRLSWRFGGRLVDEISVATHAGGDGASLLLNGLGEVLKAVIADKDYPDQDEIDRVRLLKKEFDQAREENLAWRIDPDEEDPE